MNPLMADATAHGRTQGTALSVNVNKVALLRNTRHLGIPSVVRASQYDRYTVGGLGSRTC